MKVKYYWKIINNIGQILFTSPHMRVSVCVSVRVYMYMHLAIA